MGRRVASPGKVSAVMKDALRVILVDPTARTRQDLQRQLGGMPEVDLVEVCVAYQAAIRRIAALVPDLAIVVVDENAVQGFELLETLARSHPEVALVPAGTDKDASLILQAVRAGAREYLPLPATPIELIEVVRRVCPCQEPDASAPPQRPKVLAVTGAAGGVGCTSIAVNLATTIAKLSRRETVLADFDLLLGSLEESLAVIPDNSLEVVGRNIEDMSPSLLKRWLPRHQSGLYVLPHPVSMEDAARIDPAVLGRVLDMLLQSFSAVVIDTSKGLQQTDFLAFEAADVILVVVQLNLYCTRNTVRLLQYLRQFEGFDEKIRLVVNRLNSPLSEISVKKAEQLLKTPIHWHVPNSTRLFRPARVQGIPIDEVEGGAGSKTHGVFLSIAENLLPASVPASKVRKRRFTAFR